MKLTTTQIKATTEAWRKIAFYSETMRNGKTKDEAEKIADRFSKDVQGRLEKAVV